MTDERNARQKALQDLVSDHELAVSALKQAHEEQVQCLETARDALQSHQEAAAASELSKATAAHGKAVDLLQRQLKDSQDSSAAAVDLLERQLKDCQDSSKAAVDLLQRQLKESQDSSEAAFEDFESKRSALEDKLAAVQS